MSENVTPEERETLVKRLLKIKFDNDWTQEQLAQEMGYHRQVTNGILTGKYSISRLTKNRIVWFIEQHEPRTKD